MLNSQTETLVRDTCQPSWSVEPEARQVGKEESLLHRLQAEALGLSTNLLHKPRSQKLFSEWLQPTRQVLGWSQ
jgi:hypothetical protein